LIYYTVTCKIVSMREAVKKGNWDARRIKALREHLDMSQAVMAGQMGIRQQTVSEWELGRYEPRGASARLLSIIADRGGFKYTAGEK
jgi:DNA-binding transcriptional regulator YiaG